MRILIDKPISMCDEKIRVSFEDLPQNSIITVTAESSDYYCINASTKTGMGTIWHSKGCYKSSACGTLNLTKDASTGGSYTGTHGMGLFYRMKPTKRKEAKLATNLRAIAVQKSYHIKLSVFFEEEKLGESTIERKFQADNIIHQDINQENLVARFFKEPQKRNQPAIIVLSGSDGRIEKAQNIAQLFASHGYASLAVCYFGLVGTSDCLSQIPLELIEKAIAFLKQQPEVNTQKIAVYGRSKGGELALLAGSEFPELSCVIANTPSSFIMEGLTAKNRNSKTSSWTYKKHDFPYIPFKIWDFIPFVLKKILFNQQDLASPFSKIIHRKNAEKARIKIENVQGSILLLSSELDEVWPSTLFCTQALTHLKKYNFSYVYKHKNYLHSGHLLTIAYQPIPRYTSQNWDKQLKDSVASWEETLLFLKQWAN